MSILGIDYGDARLRALFQIFIIFIFPLLAVVSGLVPVTARGWLLSAISIAVVTVLIGERWSLRALGLRFDNLILALPWYGIASGLGVVAVTIAAALLGRHPMDAWWWQPHFRFLFIIPISVAQELIFRSFLVPKLRILIQSPWLAISVNALLFALLHAIFPDRKILLPLSVALGASLTYLYLKFPNLILASFMHMVVNAAAVLYCFGSFNTSCST